MYLISAFTIQNKFRKWTSIS